MMIPNLNCTDVSVEAGRFCPKCGCDWRAEQIPVESVEKDWYGHRFPCKRMSGSTTVCTCPPRFYSRLIGIVSRDRDRVGAWQCPDCGQRWNRDTREPIMPLTPYPWCPGNPMRQDCIDAGYCKKNPNCGE